jgi:pilin isopeptide linkage protein
MSFGLCHNECATCFGPNITDCLTCHNKNILPNFSHLYDGKCINDCPEGTYEYEIDETTGFGAGWTKTGPITVKVKVSEDNATGKLSTTVSYDPEDDTITNSYDTSGKKALEIKKDGSDVWIRIPSGWIAAYYKGNRYVE